MTRVAVVTDSTAYLPRGIAEKHGITVIPLQIVLGDHTRLEGADLTPAEFADWVAAPGRRAATSQPAPAAFAAAYDRVDAADVVSVHLSERLSGTVAAARVAAARIAAAQPGRRLRVVDSRSTAMGLGFAVIAAAEAATAAAAVDAVAAAAEAASRRTRTLFYVDTLDHLRRGGRIGAAAAMVGTALSVKPLLHVVDGAIAPLDRVRTASRAIARLEELVVAEAGAHVVDLAVHHLAAPDRARELAERLRRRIPGLRSLHESEVGAVVGAHCGPGLLGVVVHRR